VDERVSRALADVRRAGLERTVARELCACPPLWREMFDRFLGSEAWVRRLASRGRGSEMYPLLVLAGPQMCGKSIFVEGLIDLVGRRNARIMRSGNYNAASDELCVVNLPDRSNHDQLERLWRTRPEVPWVQEVNSPSDMLPVPYYLIVFPSRWERIPKESMRPRDALLAQLRFEHDQLRRWAEWT
jgi:hypothetical protein